MLRDFLKEGGLYTFSSLLTKGVSLLLLPFYTTYFEPSDNGIIDILLVFGAFLNAIVCLQLNQGLGRYVAEPSYDHDRKRDLASTVIWFVAGAYIIVCGLIVLFPGIFIRMLSNEEITISTNTFRLSIVSIAVNAMFYLLGVYMRFLRKSVEFAVMSFTHAILNIALTLWFVLVFDSGINGIYYASIIVAPMIVAVQFYMIRRELTAKFKSHLLGKALQFSFPLVPASISYMVLDFIDRIYIKEFLSFADEGVYTIGAKFASGISIIIVGFSAALAPLIYERHKDEYTLHQLGRMFRLFIAIGSGGVLLLSLFSYECLYIFTQPEYFAAGEIMPILYTSILITGLGMFSPGLHIREKTKTVALLVIVSALLNVGLNYLLISEFKLPGAASATLISVFVNNFSLFVMSRKYYSFPVDPIRTLGFVLLFAIAMYFGCYWLPTQGLPTGTAILYKVIIVCGYALALLWAKMISFSSLNKLRKPREE